MALAAGTFSGCTSDESFTMTLAPDCAVNAVTFGTLSRNINSYTADGRDTSYVVTYQGSPFPIHIDQLNYQIYNTDSLPLGTLADKILFSTFTTDGTVLLRKTNDADTLYSTRDTVDFSTPRLFTVYSYDGRGRRTYTVKVNIRQTDPEAYTWMKDGETNEDIAKMSGMRMLANDGLLYLWGKTDGVTVLLTRQDAENAAWTRAETTRAGNIDLQSITYFKGAFYAMADGGLIMSDDGKDWSYINANISIENLLGADGKEIFAAAADGVYGSSDGVAWAACQIDAPAALLPQKEVVTAIQPSAANRNIESLIAVGYTDTVSVVWKKEIDLTGAEISPWSYYPYTEENMKSLPYMQELSLITYGGNLYAAGMRNGTAAIYISVDGARTWTAADTETTLPAGIGSPSEVKLAAGSGNTLWLACAGTGQMWQGYLNRLKGGGGY